MRLSGLNPLVAIVFILGMVFIVAPLKILQEGFNWVKDRVLGNPKNDPEA